MKLQNLFNKDAWDTRINKLFRNFFIKNFIKTYYYQGNDPWFHAEWQGVHCLKAPTDLWVYQELIYELRPDFIIETGTYKGGSAKYMASVCELMDHGKVITIDISPCEMEDPRVIKIVDEAGSTAPHVVQKVKEIVGDGKCLLMLDSTHRKQHVLDELAAYTPLVPVGWYTVVEDTSLGGNPILSSWGDGPMDSVKEFTKDGSWEVDRSKEKFLLTMHPKGFIKRIR